MDKPFRLLPIAAALLALEILAGCVSAGAKTRPEPVPIAVQAAPADAALPVRDPEAERLQRWADSAIAAGETEEAMEAYRQMAKLPGQASAASAGIENLRAALRSRATTVAPAPAAPAAVLPAAVAAPVSPIQSAPVRGAAQPETAEAPRIAPAPAGVLEPGRPLEREGVGAGRPPIAPGLERRVTMEFRNASVRSLFDVVARTSGMNVIFDRDVPPDLQTTIFLRNTTVRSAIEKIVLTSGLAWQVLDENTLLVYMDESNKQRDYQSLVMRSFQLANADAKFVANSMKTVLKFRDLVVDEKLNMVVVRDTPAAIAMAEKLVDMLDVAEPEVMLDVAILEVSRSDLQALGVAWPGSMNLSPLARNVASVSSTTDTTSGYVSSSTNHTLTLRDLYNLTPGSLQMTLSPATLNFSATDGKVNVLANPRIRSKNREKAKIMIGERVPNISATATSNGVTSQNITYVDVGLKLEVEPQIFPGNEIALKLGMEVSSINSTIQNSSSGTVAYRIGTRNATTVLRLKDGENQILGGLIQDADKKSVTKVPLLGDIPLLGRLFRSDSDDKSKTEIVLSITPRLVRGNRIRPEGETRFEAGTRASIRGRADADAAGSGGAGFQAEPQPAPQAQPQGAASYNRQQGEQGGRGFGGSGD